MSKRKRMMNGWMVTMWSCASLAWGQPVESFTGHWELTLPGNGVGWLGLGQEEGRLEGSILWGGGTVHPLQNVVVEDDSLRFSFRRFPDQTITATVSGDTLQLVQVQPQGQGAIRTPFAGKRIAPLPPPPDRSKARYGEPINLLNGKDLGGWQLVHASHENGWSVQDGVLVNRVVQPKDGHVRFGNLRTVDEFEDFNLTLEVKVPPQENSGIFLRGMYEVQVMDTYGRPPGPHNMGAIFSRITPSEAAEKKAGEWQQLEITLLDRHVTVVLNGTTIIDNQPLLGCTGGALSSDPFRPGPILLQGDHGDIFYRNIILTPVLKGK